MRTLARLFRRETGMSFQQWRRQLRMTEALARLAQGDTAGAGRRGGGLCQRAGVRRGVSRGVRHDTGADAAGAAGGVRRADAFGSRPPSHRKMNAASWQASAPDTRFVGGAGATVEARRQAR